MANNKVILGTETLIDLTDATATASDIASGVKAYGADGEIIEGNITVYADSETAGSANFESGVVYHEDYTIGSVSGRAFYIGATATKRMILEIGSKILTTFTRGDLGNATADDVTAGKTFSSTVGVNITGTKASNVTGSLTAASYSDTTEIDTGLTEIATFNLVKTNYSSSSYGCKMISIIGSVKYGMSKSSYLVADMTNISVSGGIVTITGGSYTGLQGEYEWIATGT